MSSGVVSLRTRISLASCPSEISHRFVGGKDDLPDSRARRGRQARGQHFDLDVLFIQTRHQEVVQLVGLDAEDGFFLA